MLTCIWRIMEFHFLFCSSYTSEDGMAAIMRKFNFSLFLAIGLLIQATGKIQVFLLLFCIHVHSYPANLPFCLGLVLLLTTFYLFKSAQPNTTTHSIMKRPIFWSIDGHDTKFEIYLLHSKYQDVMDFSTFDRFSSIQS